MTWIWVTWQIELQLQEPFGNFEMCKCFLPSHHFDFFFICFRIGINEPNNFFDMSYMTELMPGHTNYFTIKPIATIADDGMKDKLSPHQRNCRFSDEMPQNMTLFKNYSKAACMFECLIMIRWDIFLGCLQSHKSLHSFTML